MAEYVVPITIAGVAIAVILSGVSTYYAVKSSEDQAAAANAVAKQKKQEQEAAAETAAFNERQQRRRMSLLIGKENAILAASGSVPDIGTPDVLSNDIVRQAELEALALRRGGQLQAQGFAFESNIAKYQRDVAKSNVPLQITSGVLSAASSGVSAYTSITTSFDQQKYYRGGGRKASVTSDWSTGYG